jgi:L-arabinose transport system substrate-binding protein
VKHWLIAGMNDEAVLGAVRATENRGFAAADVIGVGIGGSTGKTDFEKAQPTGFFASILISPKRHGFETADMVYKWIKDGTTPPMATFTTGILITRDNYKQVMKEQGLED